MELILFVFKKMSVFRIKYSVCIFSFVLLLTLHCCPYTCTGATRRLDIFFADFVIAERH